jgi:hypothetical protein
MNIFLTVIASLMVVSSFINFYIGETDPNCEFGTWFKILGLFGISLLAYIWI